MTAVYNRGILFFLSDDVIIVILVYICDSSEFNDTL